MYAPSPKELSGRSSSSLFALWVTLKTLDAYVYYGIRTFEALHSTVELDRLLEPRLQEQLDEGVDGALPAIGFELTVAFPLPCETLALRGWLNKVVLALLARLYGSGSRPSKSEHGPSSNRTPAEDLRPEP
jgi:hypothetical protein